MFIHAIRQTLRGQMVISVVEFVFGKDCKISVGIGKRCSRLAISSGDDEREIWFSGSFTPERNDSL